MDSRKALREWIDIIEGKKTQLNESSAEVDEKDEEELEEKWKGDADVKSTGQWSKYSVGDLEKKAEALRKKKNHTAAETKKLRQINFAIRSKRGWKGGAK